MNTLKNEIQSEIDAKVKNIFDKQKTKGRKPKNPVTISIISYDEFLKLDYNQQKKVFYNLFQKYLAEDIAKAWNLKNKTVVYNMKRKYNSHGGDKKQLLWRHNGKWTVEFQRV